MKAILEVEHLKKQFGKHTVLPDLSFQVGEQEIVGFLGPNGSGKSTTLKCVTGLFHPTQGRVLVGGYDVEKNRKDALSLIGQSIEHPTLYPELSGREHLKMMANWRGVSKERVKQMEEFSGLGIHLKKPAGRYSMGMKMRLMLSIALLHQPKLLILDEPTNGLDPDAVFSLREEMKEIRKEGASVLFSSHQLGEVEKVADRVILIRQGEKLYDGFLPEQLRQNVTYALLVSERERAKELLQGIESIQLIESEDSCLHFMAKEKETLAECLALLTGVNISIFDVIKEKQDLESFYKRNAKEWDKDERTVEK